MLSMAREVLANCSGPYMSLNETLKSNTGSDVSGAWVLPAALRQLEECGENDLVEELIAIFETDTAERLETLARAVETADYSTARQEAHTIKGSCGMVGALELQALAAATEGGSPFDTYALADFDSACQRLQRMLNERL